MSGIMVGRNCARYENSTSWDPRVRNPHDFPNRDMKAFSIIHPRDHGVRKVLGNFLQGMKLFKANLRNAAFRTWIIITVMIYQNLLFRYLYFIHGCINCVYFLYITFILPFICMYLFCYCVRMVDIFI